MSMSETYSGFALSAGGAWLLVFVLGLIMIPLLRKLELGQSVRTDGPASHAAKTGTPTMGGILIILGLIPVLAAVWPPDPALGIWILAIVGFGLTGLADDFIKVVLKRPLGLRARAKLLAQITIALTFALVARHYLGLPSWVVVPFWGGRIELGAFYPAFVVIAFLGASNSVNLTDGLDGLATGAMFPSLILFSLVARAVGMTGLTLGAWALAGACLGFLWHNYHPARVFMGDTGSLALGASLAGLAVLTKTELLLVLSGGLFVAEALSVIVQVIFFRLTGRRILRMSPLHHHFELLGWSELAVVHRFWTAALVLNFLAFVALPAFTG